MKYFVFRMLFLPLFACRRKKGVYSRSTACIRRCLTTMSLARPHCWLEAIGFFKHIPLPSCLAGNLVLEWIETLTCLVYPARSSRLRRNSHPTSVLPAAFILWRPPLPHAPPPPPPSALSRTFDPVLSPLTHQLSSSWQGISGEVFLARVGC